MRAAQPVCMVGQVACTCLSTNNALLARRVFDVCIVDEASQITLPATIGALLKVCRAFAAVKSSPHTVSASNTTQGDAAYRVYSKN